MLLKNPKSYQANPHLKLLNFSKTAGSFLKKVIFKKKETIITSNLSNLSNFQTLNSSEHRDQEVKQFKTLRISSAQPPGHTFSAEIRPWNTTAE